VSLYKQKFNKPNRIESQLLEKYGNNYKTLAFHLVSEIYFGGIETTDDVRKWFKRSLAYFQNKSFDDSVVDSTLELLRKCGAIGLEDDKWNARTIGKVASMFYISPFDVSDLYFNFKSLFDSGKENDDHLLSLALGNIDSQRSNIVNKAEKDEMSLYANQARLKFTGKFLADGAIKAGYCYYSLLNGTNSQALASFQRNLQFDFNRLSQILIALDSMGGSWNRSGWLKTLEGRIAYGVPAHLINLCKIDNIGRVRANKLYDAGIKTAKDIANTDAEKLGKIINMKGDAVKKIIQQAQGL
jgi:helicase